MYIIVVHCCILLELTEKLALVQSLPHHTVDSGKNVSKCPQGLMSEYDLTFNSVIGGEKSKTTSCVKKDHCVLHKIWKENYF